MRLDAVDRLPGSSPMRFLVRASLCEPNAIHNEDRAGATERAAWVLDGATGLGGERTVPGPTDAAWLVARIDEALRGEANTGGNCEALLVSAMRRVVARFREEATRPDAPDMEKPSTCIAMARLCDGAVLEFANLGDCKILHRTRDGGITAYGSSAVEALEATLEAEIAVHQGNGVPAAEIWQRILPTIRRNRARMNQPDGYWILDLSGRGVPHLQRFPLVAEAGDEVLLLTDGFYRLVEKYALHSDGTLFEAARRDGLPALYDTLRQVEAEDVECRRFVRAKPRDDATAIHLVIEAPLHAGDR